MAKDILNSNKLIQQAAKAKAEVAFTPEYQFEADPEELLEEGLGIALATWAEWDGVKLMRVFRAALEDANFHTEAGIVEDLIKKLEEN